jgi:hypothetical protein
MMQGRSNTEEGERMRARRHHGTGDWVSVAPNIYRYDHADGRTRYRCRYHGANGRPRDTFEEAAADLAHKVETQRARNAARYAERLKVTQPNAHLWTVESIGEQRRTRLRTWEHEPHDDRPKTRGECMDGPRPCPWMSCRYHLGLELQLAPSGNAVTDAVPIRYHDPESLDQMAQTCALDVADEGGHTLDEVGALTDRTRERIRQIEEMATTRRVWRGVQRA